MDIYIKNSSLISFVYNFTKTNGIKGLYRGLGFPFFGFGIVNCVGFGTFGTITNHLKRSHNTNILSLYQLWIAGLISGTTSSLVILPLERSKIWSQVHQTSAYNSIKMLYNKYGIYHGFCIGYNMTLIRCLIQFGFYFPIYEFNCRLISPHTIGHKLDTSNMAIFVSGGISGAVVSIIGYPVDVIKTKIQGSPLNYYKSIWDCVISTYNIGGYRLFYAGVSATILRGLALHSSVLLGYERVLTFLERYRGGMDIWNIDRQS